MTSSVRKGVRWQVGNEKSIRTWYDRWLPTSSTYKVVSPPPLELAESRVCDLIDISARSWKTELIQKTFMPHEADVITGIALSSHMPEDRQIWALTGNGRFTVRSAYSVAMEMVENGGKGTVSVEGPLRKFWRSLWHLNLPHKIRHFAWRACKDIIPTKENLMRRKVLVEGSCEACHQEVESSGHLFWRCELAREVWSTSKLFPSSLMVNFNPFLDLIWYGLMEAKREWGRLEKIITLAWAIWSNRNKVRTGGGVKKSGQQLVHGALDYLFEYQEGVVEVSKPSPSLPVFWCPPRDRFKINVDSAVFASQQFVGVGVLIRDSEGRVVGACSKKIQAPLGAVEVEAKVVEFGLQFAKDMLIQYFILEGDSLVLMNALNEISSTAFFSRCCGVWISVCFLWLSSSGVLSC